MIGLRPRGRAGAPALALGSALMLACGGGNGRDASAPVSSLGLPPASHAPAASASRSGAADDYVASIQESRTRKDAFFRSSPESPVPAGERATLPPLDYYPIDPSWRLTLPVERYEKPETFMLVTNMGEQRRFRREGQVRVAHDGASATLQLYREIEDAGDSATLWVPFTDAGAGRETYPAGRYMDAAMSPDGTVVLDFNLAYNPYCAYGWAFSCPMTPPENRLKIAVRAGERGFHAP